MDKKPSSVVVEVALEEALAVGDEEENVLETKNVVDVVAHLQLIILSTCSCKLSQSFVSRT